jgi:hypothetical protein
MRLDEPHMPPGRFGEEKNVFVSFGAIITLCHKLVFLIFFPIAAFSPTVSSSKDKIQCLKQRLSQ